MDVKTPAGNVNVKGLALERGAGVECVERVGPVGRGAARFFFFLNPFLYPAASTKKHRGGHVRYVVWLGM